MSLLHTSRYVIPHDSVLPGLPPALVLQATNAWARRPGYEATSLPGVSNLWNVLWNELMEWTDGMEYQQIKIIAKTRHRGCSKVVNAVSTIASAITI